MSDLSPFLMLYAIFISPTVLLLLWGKFSAKLSIKRVLVVTALLNLALVVSAFLFQSTAVTLCAGDFFQGYHNCSLITPKIADLSSQFALGSALILVIALPILVVICAVLEGVAFVRRAFEKLVIPS